MTRSKLIIASSLLLFIMTACSRPATPPEATPATEQPRISTQSVVKVTTEPAEIVAGESKEVVVKINTQSGYHINANPASFAYLKATELDLQDTPGLMVDYTYYPNPQVKKFAFSEQALKVYEGETQLKVMLNAEKAAPKGPLNVPAKLNVQACDDKVCYPPASIDISIPVTIK